MPRHWIPQALGCGELLVVTAVAVSGPAAPPVDGDVGHAFLLWLGAEAKGMT